MVITAAVLLYARSGVLCAPLCLTGDFDSQLRHILHKQMLSTQDHANILSRILDDLQHTLNQRWKDFKLIPFGSLTTGLGAKTSDADICVELRNLNSTAYPHVLEETEKLFKKQPELYFNIKHRLKPTFQMGFFHNPTQRKVDLSFAELGNAAIQGNSLVKYYFSLDKRFLPLARLLKLWFRAHNLTGAGSTTSNYGMYLLIIFYLQQKNMAPPVYVLQKDAKSHIIDNWDMGYNELPYRSANKENLHQLLGGFFKYYSEFNFKEYIVSPFTGHPIQKNAFKDIENFPKAYSLYNNKLKRTLQHKIKNDLNTSTDVCIQDFLIHDLNVGQGLSRKKKLKYLLKSAATLFKDLPRDSFLRAILTTDQHNKTLCSL